MADEEGDRDADLLTPRNSGPQIVLGPKPAIEDDRHSVLLPAVPDRQLSQSEVGVSDLLRVLRQLIDGEGRGCVANGWPDRSDAERLPDVAGSVVRVGLGGELPERRG